MGKKGGRVKTVPVQVAPGDKFGKWRALFVHRGQPLMQVAPLGPNVEASDPEELERKTDEAIAAATAGEPN